MSRTLVGALALFFAFTFLSLSFFSTNNFLVYSGRVGYTLNLFIVIFNLLPIKAAGGFVWDGKKILNWNKVIWMSLSIGTIALIVFDCSSFDSLLAVEEWVGMVSNIPPERKLFVGTKLDLCDDVDYDAIHEITSRYGIDFLLVSSKEGTNIGTLARRLGEMAQRL